MSQAEQIEVCEVLGVNSSLGIDLQMWGSSALSFIQDDAERQTLEGLPYVEARINQSWDAEGLRSLRESHTLRIRDIPGIPRRAIKDVVQGSSGDLRNIIALLLFLNRTADIQTVREEGMAHGMIERRPRPLMPHRVVSLRIDPMPRLMKLVANREHIERRLHDVRGHYCHDRRARESGCPHGAEMAGDFGEWWTEYEVLRWKCQECGGKRWWRREHARGTANIGVTTQSYAVTSHRTTPEI